MARTCSFLIAYGPGDSVIWDVTVLETLDRNGFSPGWKPYCPVWTSAESSPTLTPQTLEIEKKNYCQKFKYTCEFTQEATVIYRSKLKLACLELKSMN